MPGQPAREPAGQLAGRPAGRLAGRLAGRSACWLAGRRTAGISGKILVNGHDRTEQRALEFFQENSGYLLQLAETTSSELTVRENLVYAAMLRIPHMTLAEVLVRVDQVLLSLGMLEMAERAVGEPVGQCGLRLGAALLGGRHAIL